MRYYGLKQFNGINFIRCNSVANQFAYSFPMSYSNSTFRTRANILYVCEGSGPITVAECETNNDLVGFVYQPGNAYVPEDEFGNNIVKLQSGDITPVLTLITLNQELANSRTIDVVTVTVDGSYTIPVNTYAIVAEGTITVGNNTVDANTDLHLLGKRNEERTIEGSGKLITFKVT